MSVILLVEDNPHIMKINAEMLTMRGYEVLRAATAGECREALEWHGVDLVVLDIMLPDGNGVDLCREIKERYNTPVLFLSALGESKDVVDGLRAGGDDYLAKPYDLEVLAARIEARLRAGAERSRYVVCGLLKLDIISGCGYCDGRDMLLTQKEFSVLLLLARNQGKTVPKETIAKEVWGAGPEDDSRALWTTISRLRKKLDSVDSDVGIELRRSGGYVLERI